MTTATSITKSFRGFHYQNDWERAVDWSGDMERQAKSDNEVEWSILVNTHTGMPVMRYSRGMGVQVLSNDKLRHGGENPNV